MIQPMPPKMMLSAFCFCLLILAASSFHAQRKALRSTSDTAIWMGRSAEEGDVNHYMIAADTAIHDQSRAKISIRNSRSSFLLDMENHAKLGFDCLQEVSSNPRVAHQGHATRLRIWHDAGYRLSLASQYTRQRRRLLEIIEREEGSIKIDEPIQGIKLLNDGGSSAARDKNQRRISDGTSDFVVRLIRDQLIMARVYCALAQSHKQYQILRDLRVRIRESQRTLGDAAFDSDLPRNASERIKAMNEVLFRARGKLYDCTAISKMLRAMVQSAEEKASIMKKQTTFLRQLAANTLPKNLHCFSLQLTINYYKLPNSEREFPGQHRLGDNSLFHYAIFSNNILATSVVVNSAASNAKQPWKHVFHIGTDKLNYAAMRMWFLRNPPARATIEILNVNSFSWLNTSQSPELQDAPTKEYHSKGDHSSFPNMIYRNPKYLSTLNHLRFYLPQVLPELDKVLFLDDDVVVQQDLAPLWAVDLHGNVNGAVEICEGSFHRFDKYLNFSNPQIRDNFDPHACGWAYGMNIFDLQQWKKKGITNIYNQWQSMNEDRQLWKLGTLPPALVTFYNSTYPLDKNWHVSGLGYNPYIEEEDIKNAGVVHYNGNMKPWLEIGISKYRQYWTKYVNYDHEFLQQCNINQ